MVHNFLTWKTVGRILYFPVIIYLTKDIQQGSRKETFSEGQWTQRKRIFKVKFLHGFAFQKNTGVSKLSGLKLYMDLFWAYSSAVCESSPWWPCSISRLAVMVFIAPCVYGAVFYNLVPAAVSSDNDGQW
ncbi:hypothetical protein AMECASPLE_001708 [Ameca splendens]|uniref:Uncharacterized protein n=1 Tax=Ameca splendens TaxID=208324 RepID=A0ABV0Y913_9TELE